MRKILGLVTFLIAMMGLNLQTLSAQSGEEVDTICNHSKKTHHEFFPVVRLKAEPIFMADNYNASAFSLMSEIGPKNHRVSGTYGFLTSDNSRFKIGAEWLGQKFHYNFSSGKSYHWVRQLAIGGKYQQLFDCPQWVEGFQLGVSYSHGLGHHLGVIDCVTRGETLHRRISNSVFWSAEAGVMVSPWEENKMIFSVTYDNIYYHRHHQSTQRLSGAGFCVDFYQKLPWELALDIKYQLKRPYDYIEAMVNWSYPCEYGDLTIGIFGNHVHGRKKLPSSSSVGVELRLVFDSVNMDWLNWNSCCQPAQTQICCYDTAEVVKWVSDPAVYRPQALAIADQGFTR